MGTMRFTFPLEAAILVPRVRLQLNKTVFQTNVSKSCQTPCAVRKNTRKARLEGGLRLGVRRGASQQIERSSQLIHKELRDAYVFKLGAGEVISPVGFVIPERVSA